MSDHVERLGVTQRQPVAAPLALAPKRAPQWPRWLVVVIGVALWVPFLEGLGHGLRAEHVSEPAILGWQVGLSVAAGVLAIAVLAGWVRMPVGWNTRDQRHWLQRKWHEDNDRHGMSCSCPSCWAMYWRSRK